MDVRGGGPEVHGPAPRPDRTMFSGEGYWRKVIQELSEGAKSPHTFKSEYADSSQPCPARRSKVHPLPRPKGFIGLPPTPGREAGATVLASRSHFQQTS